MSCWGLHEVRVEKGEQRCSICDTYTRKIEEVEVILIGRDAIIEALKLQIKKYEKNYKNLFNDFEKLRFKHSLVLQDNSCLKQINAKLEEFAAAKNQINQKFSCCNDSCGEKQSVVNISCNQRLKESKKHPSPPTPQKGSFSNLQDLNTIEQLLKNQNDILQEVLEKISIELISYKSNKSTNSSIPCQETESGDYLNVSQSNLLAEVQKLNSIVDELQKENEQLKQHLLNKKNTLTKSTLCCIPSPTDPLIMTDNAMTIARLQNELIEKEKHFEDCSCKLLDQLNDMHDNNRNMSETVSVVTSENKNNLAMISKLKDELNKVNEEYDKKIDAMKNEIAELENELEESKATAKKLKQIIESWENETENLKERLKHVLDENKQLKQCECDAEKEFAIKLASLEAENDEMQKELTEKTLELTEYEEENRHFCQKMEMLTNYNNQLLSQIKELQDEQESREKDTFEQGTQMAPAEVQPSPSTLQLEKQSLEDKCKKHQREVEDASQQLNKLKCCIKSQLGELDKLSDENDSLKQEMEQLRRDSKSESERLQALVNHNQNQVEMLLKEHDEKTAEIETVANELDNIRKCVTKDTENYLTRIRMMENERDELKKKLNEFEKCGCMEETCDEVDRLKAELIKKQCIILELEKSVDSFNETLKNFDRTAEELACENACLKSDRDARINDLETMQLKLAERTKELDATRKQLENLEHLSKAGTTTKKTLEAESKQLKDQCECSLKTVKKLELENELLKREVEKLQENKGQTERALVKTYELQTEMASLKQNHCRRESTISRKLEDLQNAYDELKHLFDKTNQENSKLKEKIKNCHKSDDESKSACTSLQKENEKLLKQTHMMKDEVDSLHCECDKLKKDLAKKWIEIEQLTDITEQQKKEKQLCQKNCQVLMQKQECKEKDLNGKLDELRKDYDQKSHELKKIKKQWECCAKQSQITREEYNNLRKEYKEIKSMLSEQIKRYKLDTGNIETGQQCDVVRDLKRQILDKENQIAALQQKLKDASYEIIEMKDYIHKLISDNNILKSGINSLIGNLERKIKGPSFGSLPTNCAEAIAGEILSSLSAIEDVVMRNGEGCASKACDCMSEITSQYSFNEPQQGPSDCLVQCKKKYDVLSKSMSEPITKCASEPNSSDSEDPVTCMDEHSLEFFKGAVRDLKHRIDCTMKEKCCDLEDYPAQNRNK